MWLNLTEVFLVSILPISLIKFKVISAQFRLFMLGGIFVLVSILVYFSKIPLIEFGTQSSNFHLGILVYVIITIISVLFLLTLSKTLGNKKADEWHKDPHFLFLFIPISFAQQFLFQGFILFKLHQSFNIFIAIILTALIFGYMHTIYPRPLLSMALGTLSGLAFATIYTIYPNIFVVSIVHAILNFSAVYLGFFTFTDSEGKPRKTKLFIA